MAHTRTLTQALGIAHPIIQGPFGGGLSSAALTSTVSELGGLGSFGLQSFATEQFDGIVASIRERTHKPFALNLWVSNVDERAQHYSDADHARWQERMRPFFAELGLPLPPKPDPVKEFFNEQAEALIRLRPPVFSFVFGVPDRAILDECRKQQIRTIGTATTADEALELEAAGVDVIVATGSEAGGHRVSWQRSAEDSLTGTFALIQQVTRVVRVPVVAAGGIANGNGLKAALALGAQGVQVGTAFLACDESNATAVHKERLFSPDAKSTTLTRAFSGRLARGIISRIAEATKDHPQDLAPFPFQGQLMRALRTAAMEQGHTHDITFWSGQIAPLLQHRQATAVFADLLSGLAPRD